MGKYLIEKIDHDQAKELWVESPQAEIFTNPTVLEILAEQVHWWGVFKTEELRCVWPVVLDQDAKPEIAEFAYWQSPLWHKDTFNQPYHRSVSLTTSVYKLFINTFIQKYGSIKASLHPSILDVRIFDWWNYHQSDKPKFSIKPKYSACLEIDNIELKDILKGFRRDRRRDLKLSEKASQEIYLDTKCSSEELIHLYCQTLGSDESIVQKSLNSLLEIVRKGYGWIQTARRHTDDSICAISIILKHKNQANLVINIADSWFKSNRLMAQAILNLIDISKKNNLKYFDFNGANSPNRGDDKHSYGAKPVLYFEIEYNQDKQS